MKYLTLLLLTVAVECVYSAEEGTFICRRVETQCGNDGSVKVRKPKPSNLKENELKVRRKPKPKPKPKPNASNSVELLERLRYLEERVKRLEEMNPIFALDKEDSPLSELEEDTCHIWHRNKCFMFVEKIKGAISLEEAQQECEELGGDLADIFDMGHFRKLENYVRETLEEEEEIEYFITGMMFDRETQTVLKRNGTPANFIKWYSEMIYPTTKTGDTRIHIQVNQIESRPSGMYNVSPLTSAKSALCEIPKRIYEQRFGRDDD